VWTGLVAYDPQTGEPSNAAAASVSSPDRRVWTVRLRPGGTFQDGSPVTARSFTGAWTAVLREGWAGARLLTEVAHVKGARRGADAVAGLKAKDDLTFEVVLDRPLSGFPALLGDPAFFPLPESVLASRDWASYGKRPVGNGPFLVASRSAREIVLRRRSGEGRSVVVKTIPDAMAQYNAAAAGDLDVATRVPPDRHESMEADFGRRHLAVPGRDVTYLAFPAWAERLASPAVRSALSMAIDRSAVAEGALGHQYSPADALVAPGIRPGQREGQCRLCVHDSKAAVAALTPLLEAGSGFDDDYTAGLVADAERAATPGDGVIPARLAESAMLRDMPAMPLWSAHDHLVWSERVRGVTAGAFAGLRLDRLTVRE
jgi:oligopeptide transport system substrate-binding protein